MIDGLVNHIETINVEDWIETISVEDWTETISVEDWIETIIIDGWRNSSMLMFATYSFEQLYQVLRFIA